jgi:LacI family transcriptional regulator
MAATLKDIARRAGVTAATVSMVINNKAKISNATREKILTIAKELNYYPNITARGLATKKLNAIGVVVPNLASSFVIRILQGIKSTLRDVNYTLLLFDTIGGSETEAELLARVVQQGRVDGIIIISSSLSDDDLKTISTEKLPAIMVAKRSDLLSSIYVDHENASYEAVKYLLDKGHERIAIVTINKTNLSIDQRINGYKRALSSENVSLSEELFFEVTEDNMLDGTYIAPKILNHPRKPTAIFCPAGDMVAIGIVKEYVKRGVKIPDQMAVVGYDDIPAAEVIEPTLTTVRQPKLEMGDNAINMIIDKISGKYELKSKVMQTKFIIRQSA